MIEAMGVVGARYQANEIFVPEMLVRRQDHEKRRGGAKAASERGSYCKYGKYIIGTVAGTCTISARICGNDAGVCGL
jgi:methanogenic corrinoid protein MtbC1